MTETSVSLSRVRTCTVLVCAILLASCQYKFVEREFDCSSEEIRSEERSVIAIFQPSQIINENTGEICTPGFEEFENDPAVVEMPIMSTFVDPGTYTVEFKRAGTQICGPFIAKEGLTYSVVCGGGSKICEVWEGHGGEGWGESNQLMTCERK